MMWNFLIGGLLLGSTVLLYDGSPGYPDLRALWRFAETTKMTYFGTSAPYLMACRKAGLSPGSEFDLSTLRALGSTGAPLPAEGFGWVYENVKKDLLLGSVCGGSDVCTAFILSCPLLPVYAGEIQCRGLGAKVEAFDEAGSPVMDTVGELVLTEPMPSMPVFLWNDVGNRKLHESYFSFYPGVWRHGDWVKITHKGSCVVYGRSDSTLNRGGVRMGTSEFYSVVESMSEVKDSLVVDTGGFDQEGRLWLFLVVEEGVSLGDEFKGKISQRIRQSLSPRHVPDELHIISEVPRTLNGKKLEVPIKRILQGESVDVVVNPDTVANARVLDEFVSLSSRG